LPYYPANARCASLDEVDFSKKFEPLTINEVKDIDSILEALRERAYYTGNVQLGNSRFIEGSTDVIESFYIYDSTQIGFSKYVAYGYNMEYAESVFGSMNHGNCNHSIAIHDSDYLTRCFEVCSSEEACDAYYSHRLFSCKNCMFSFNIRNASYAIGNLRLPPEKYLALKRKLLAEMAQELKANKRLPTLMQLVGDSEPEQESLANLRQKMPPSRLELHDRRPVDKAFENTASVLFGRSPGSLTEYGSWLTEFTRKTKRDRSAVSGEEIIVADHSRYFDFPRNRLVTERESLLLGSALSFGPESLGNLSLKNAGKYLGKIAFFHPGVDYGELANIIESQVNVSSTNCFRSVLNMYSKNCAYNYYVWRADSAFGCNSVRKSSFIVRCHCSSKLIRSFEVDSSNDCSDAYFCHNCENVRDSMFCFNTKNRRYAIGNGELPREKYLGIKRSLCDGLADALENERKVPLNIFNLLEERS
ncbi:MAG: hypothetical protein NT157_05675, partial [Candidatus Micrarchaeota archaeon]|nr:hypothetical protein [Candidatus Micrarchaeota archaeon]